MVTCSGLTGKLSIPLHISNWLLLPRKANRIILTLQILFLPLTIAVILPCNFCTPSSNNITLTSPCTCFYPNNKFKKGLTKSWKMTLSAPRTRAGAISARYTGLHTATGFTCTRFQQITETESTLASYSSLVVLLESSPDHGACSHSYSQDDAANEHEGQAVGSCHEDGAHDKGGSSPDHDALQHQRCFSSYSFPLSLWNYALSVPTHAYRPCHWQYASHTNNAHLPAEATGSKFRGNGGHCSR